MIELFNAKVGRGDVRLSIIMAISPDLLESAQDLVRYLVESDVDDVEVLVGVNNDYQFREARTKNMVHSSASSNNLVFTNAGVYPTASLIERTIKELEAYPDTFGVALRLDGLPDGRLAPNPYAIGDWQAMTKQTFEELGWYNYTLNQAAHIDGSLMSNAIDSGKRIVIFDERVYHSWHESRFHEGAYQLLSRRNVERSGQPEMVMHHPEVIGQSDGDGKVIAAKVHRQLDTAFIDELPHVPSNEQYWQSIFETKRERVLWPHSARIEVWTRNPVAIESPDHISPDSAVRSWTQNSAFAEEMSWITGRSPIRLLDLGCALGWAVSDCLGHGHFAVGLEGCDAPLKHGLGDWPTLGNRFLFTCDIGKPFWITADKRLLTFDVVTAWDVLEHIPEDNLDVLLGNVWDALQPGGYFVSSIATDSSSEGGVEHHICQKPQEWWIERISQKFEKTDIEIHNPVQPVWPTRVFRKPKQ